MKKTAFLMAAAILYALNGNSQSNLDTLICRYLVEIRQMEKPINKIERNGNKLLKSTNYFIDKKPTIRLSDSTVIQSVIFGCYKSHANKYLLVLLQTNSKSVFYFYGNNKLLDEMDKLKNQIWEDLRPSLTDEALAALINYLSSCYL